MSKFLFCAADDRRHVFVIYSFTVCLDKYFFAIKPLVSATSYFRVMFSFAEQYWEEVNDAVLCF